MTIETLEFTGNVENLPRIMNADPYRGEVYNGIYEAFYYNPAGFPQYAKWIKVEKHITETNLDPAAALELVRNKNICYLAGLKMVLTEALKIDPELIKNWLDLDLVRLSREQFTGKIEVTPGLGETESIPCSRCGGTGDWGVQTIYGRKCLKCNGRGTVKITPAEKAKYDKRQARKAAKA